MSDITTSTWHNMPSWVSESPASTAQPNISWDLVDTSGNMAQSTVTTGGDWDTYKEFTPAAEHLSKIAPVLADFQSLTIKSGDEAESQTFDLFPSLPKELQVKIWQFAGLHSKIVEVKLGTYCYIDDYGEPYEYEDYSLVKNTLPVLDACNTARDEIIRSHKDPENEYLIHFTPSDILVMGVSDLIQCYTREIPRLPVDNVRVLAIKNYDLSDEDEFFRRDSRDFARRVALYVNLQELILLDPVMDFEDQVQSDGWEPFSGMARKTLIKRALPRISAELELAMNQRRMPRGHVGERPRSVWWDHTKIRIMSEAKLKRRLGTRKLFA